MELSGRLIYLYILYLLVCQSVWSGKLRYRDSPLQTKGTAYGIQYASPFYHSYCLFIIIPDLPFRGKWQGVCLRISLLCCVTVINAL